MAAEPAELLAERLGPLAIDERARRAEKCPQPPGRDAELMQVLRIVAAPGTRVVGEQRPVVGVERDPERLARRRVLRQLGRCGRPVQVERPVELRLQLAGLVSACLAQLLGQLAQRLLVPVDQLDLDLAEAPGDPLAFEHGDAVVDDLGALGQDHLAAGAQAGDRHERRAAEVRGQQVDELGRRTRRRAAQLELEPGRVARQLQLPHPGAVLDAMPKRDPVPREAQIRGVVVGRDEDARRHPAAAELGEYEALCRGKA